ncbi:MULTISPECIES: sodium:proton antiporter [Auritidibacter]|uniref:sodium:proton antiporter n=1 Tax=Auritidibacter TaxID=1160973 RepID=UPI000D72B396|nr:MULTISPECIES: cation:proton antiporter subunit C [Auritidibacter]AXR73471.1 cation:proton antiporter [Auritidibacter sp. NML130574]WHS28008.1 cation:proton antiporter subunit C [Auritidibacter ignavus]
MTLALTVGLLVAGAVYLFTKREMLRIILGFILLGHAGNLVLMAAGGASRRHEPFGEVDPELAADPLPQAMVLTAIVIAFSITVFMLVLAVTGDRGDRTAGRTETLDTTAEAVSDATIPGTATHTLEVLHAQEEANDQARSAQQTAEQSQQAGTQRPTGGEK